MHCFHIVNAKIAGIQMIMNLQFICNRYNYAIYDNQKPTNKQLPWQHAAEILDRDVNRMERQQLWQIVCIWLCDNCGLLPWVEGWRCCCLNPSCLQCKCPLMCMHYDHKHCNMYKLNCIRFRCICAWQDWNIKLRQYVACCRLTLNIIKVSGGRPMKIDAWPYTHTATYNSEKWAEIFQAANCYLREPHTSTDTDTQSGQNQQYKWHKNRINPYLH